MLLLPFFLNFPDNLFAIYLFSLNVYLILYLFFFLNFSFLKKEDFFLSMKCFFQRHFKLFPNGGKIGEKKVLSMVQTSTSLFHVCMLGFLGVNM